MNLTSIGPGLFAAGLVGLAGGLYALQRLRVRHREQVVVTTLFWREEIEEQRARTLVERFRHPLTYALCLGLAALLWLGAARPDTNRAEGTSHVLLLDGSAAMASEGRFDAARTALLEEIERCPRDRTEVLFCGADLRRVLAPGEDLRAPRRAPRAARAGRRGGVHDPRAPRGRRGHSLRGHRRRAPPRGRGRSAPRERPCRGPRPRG